MEWKSNLRRAQSLRSVPSSCDKPSWPEVGLRDKRTSVSHLVSRYQTTVVSTSIQQTTTHDGATNQKQVIKEVEPSNLEYLMLRNEERERSRTKSSLTRSKSLGSLHKTATSIGTLKALFESKAATPNDSKRVLRDGSIASTNRAVDILPVMNGKTEEVKVSAEKPTTQTPAHPPCDNAKEDHVTRKVASTTRLERRKTIGGIDFEKLASSQADDKRRSFADFRDSSFVQTKDKLSISVKAMSALYLSKAAPQESNRSILKQAQDQTSESGKRAKLTKMSEEPKQRTGCLSTLSPTRHPQGPEDVCGTLSQKRLPSHLSKEELHKQQQKSELKRLLKHTHPELRTLDQVVDEELAEVLGSEVGVTAGETGYEGEVFSRRLLFENCALTSKVSPYSHVAERTTEKDDVCKKPAEFEEPAESRRVQGFNEDDTKLGCDQERECEEEVTRIDVQATRRKFENQSVNTQPLIPDKKYKGKVSGDETRGVQRQEQQSEKCSKEIRHSQNKIKAFENAFEDETTSLPEKDEFGEVIKTSAALFQNNPFIHTNIEREQSLVHTSKHEGPAGDGGADQNYQMANVKNRTQVFESMPFHTIRRQNQDELETMVENMIETLNSLFQVNVIRSSGSIIEVNETMLAKKAKFTLSENGPEIKYDEVAEGGAQNLILQFLPRANLKPQITYLKEGSSRRMEATVVNVPVHQHQYANHQDEFKTANVVQVVEDILSQDNSLRKGVIFQEYGDRCAEIIVYSLYKYFDEEDVKSYSPPQDAECETPETKSGEVGRTDNQEPQTGYAEPTVNRLIQTSCDQTCHGSIRPEIAVRGNVKLFKSCIEKGDLEYLRILQADSTMEEQEVPPNVSMAGEGREINHDERGNQAEESSSEWVPVDVKRLKNMFSGDGRIVQPKQHKYLYQNQAQAAFVSSATSHNVPVEKSQCSTECSTEAFLQSQVKDTLRECDDQARGDSCDLPVGPQGSSLHLETEDGDVVHQAELVEVVDDNDEISDLQAAIHSLQQATNEAKSLHLSSQEKQTLSDGESESKEAVQRQVLEAASVSVHSSEMTADKQDDEEVVFQGKLKAALDSLEKSNINVTRGDFRAAMIYRNSKPNAQKERSQPGSGASLQQTMKTESSPLADPKPTQEPMKDEMSKKQVTTENVAPQNQSKSPNKPSTSPASERKRNPTYPKPEIPPKPEHLKLNPRGIQSTITKNPEATQTKPIRRKGTVLPTSASTPVSNENEHQQDRYEMKNDSGSDSGVNSMDHQRHGHADTAKQMSQENEPRIPVQGPVITLAKDDADNIVNQQQKINASLEDKALQDVPNKESMGETDESPVDFHKACKKFESKKAFSVKSAPVKPKRVKIAQAENKNPKQKSGDNSSSIITQVGKEPNKKDLLNNDPNSCGQTADDRGKHVENIIEESKVEMREKKRPTETEDERMQRLSVHMDEIMRGNMTAALEIFDNLRKQEELQNILCQVKEIEQDTCEVDVGSLRKVFENVPDWVVGSEEKKIQKEKVENKEDRLLPTRAESSASMAHVFGDLERASEEIINLKEQTLTRLLNIEETIKKALCSVSTLKSDSDIAGLSTLFKESLGTVQGSPSFGNIRKISIESSRTKTQPTKGNPAETGNKAGPVNEASPKQQSPPSSPAFISIQSAARKADKAIIPPQNTAICPTCKHNPNTEEKFRTTKTLTCNSPAQNRKGGEKQHSPNQHNRKRELKVLEVQTDSEGNRIPETETVPKNYEGTGNSGNMFYSSQTSTVIITQPETITSTGLTVATPGTYHVTSYPDVRLPVNQKP